MSEKCNFCSRVLSSEDDIVNHYEQEHKITRENSPAFESYIDSLRSDPLDFFVKKCNYCDEFFFDARSRSIHIFKNRLKILNTAQVDNMIIRRTGNRFIEFSIDYKHFSKVYDFTKPEKMIFDFIGKGKESIK